MDLVYPASDKRDHVYACAACGVAIIAPKKATKHKITCKACKKAKLKVTHKRWYEKHKSEYLPLDTKKARDKNENVKTFAAHMNQRWLAHEIDYLRRHASGYSNKSLALSLGRSIYAVAGMKRKLSQGLYAEESSRIVKA